MGYSYIKEMRRSYSVIIEQDEDGYFIASVAELPGCHTQAKTLDELNKRIKEAIKLYLEVEKNSFPFDFQRLLKLSLNSGMLN